MLPVLSSTKSMKNLSITCERANENHSLVIAKYSETTKSKINSIIDKGSKNKKLTMHVIPKLPKPLKPLEVDSVSTERQDTNEDQQNLTYQGKFKEKQNSKYLK